MSVKWAFVKGVNKIPKNCPHCNKLLSEAEIKQEKCSECNYQWIIKG